MSKVKIIATVGPATNTLKDILQLRDKGVDFIRINMSHSTTEDLKFFIGLAKQANIPFIIDTEGSQVRTGNMEKGVVHFQENDEVHIYSRPVDGNRIRINLTPSEIVQKLEPGDLIHIDFDTLILRVMDTKPLDKGYIIARAVSGGYIGKNKAVIIDPALKLNFTLPPLTPKDYQSIEIGLHENIGHIAVSFVRNKKSIAEVRRATFNRMQIISKVECMDALEHLDEIIDNSDFLLIDRGDLSKEIPIIKIPLAQKIILNRAQKKGVGVFVATNLLESMVQHKKPTRAEVNDVVNTILDGAEGLILSAETAVGKYPMRCINMLTNLLSQSFHLPPRQIKPELDPLVQNLEKINYLTDPILGSSLIPPHGGKLVNRVVGNESLKIDLNQIKKLPVSTDLLMDAEQIALGTFSPLEGFLGEKDFLSVIHEMKLSNGISWPLPIVLDVSIKIAEGLKIGESVALTDQRNEVIAILHIEDIYEYDKLSWMQKVYGTTDPMHPGIQRILQMGPFLIGGKVDLLKRRNSSILSYELTPRQVRRLFEERGWKTVIGFHTRNVLHRIHEFMQLEALESTNCDGLFIHPVIGSKKPGDYHSEYILKSYEIAMQKFYPEEKALLAAFATFSRYAGPREAVFTAICRKNFGCSHFIMGRDHTGVANYYGPYASQELAENFPDLGMKILKYDRIFYSKSLKSYIHEGRFPDHPENDKHQISGTEARKMFQKGKMPPSWFMRREVSTFIKEALQNQEEVFVRDRMGREGKGLVLWFTGLSGSGKTTIANELKEKLWGSGKKVALIDGDEIRKTSNRNLGFSREGIRENNRIIAEVAKTRALEVDYIIVPIISPYREDREFARRHIGDPFAEVHIHCPLETCMKRDPKGLYKKAIEGTIKDFIGFSETSPYESPLKPEITLNTEMNSLKENLNQIMTFIENFKG